MIATKHPNAMRLLTLRLLVLTAAVTAVFLLLASTGSADTPPPPMTTHVVGSGETLWEIAAGLVDPGDDIRVMVGTIVEINQLDSGVIQPGMAIYLPTE